jgi:hypothetical protein
MTSSVFNVDLYSNLVVFVCCDWMVSDVCAMCPAYAALLIDRRTRQRYPGGGLADSGRSGGGMCLHSYMLYSLLYLPRRISG